MSPIRARRASIRRATGALPPIAALALLTVGALVLGGCDGTTPSRPTPASLACDADTEPHAASKHGAPQGEELLELIAAAERDTVFTGYRKTVFGTPGEARETRMRTSRYPSGKTLLEWEAGDETKKGWVFRSRYRWLEHPDLLVANYTVEIECGDTPAVAWRDTCRVRVTPRRPGRPSLEMLVDSQTWLILREEWRDHDDRVRRVGFFETIEYGAPADLDAPEGAEALSPPGEKRPEGDGDGAASTATEPDAASPASLGWSPLRVGHVPAGFRRIASSVRNGSLREYWSDGLAAFSVRQRPIDGSEPAGVDGQLARSSCAVGSSLSGVLAGMSVRVVGNLPADELERVARDLRTPTQ